MSNDFNKAFLSFEGKTLELSPLARKMEENKKYIDSEYQAAKGNFFIDYIGDTSSFKISYSRLESSYYLKFKNFYEYSREKVESNIFLTFFDLNEEKKVYKVFITDFNPKITEKLEKDLFIYSLDFNLKVMV